MQNIKILMAFVLGISLAACDSKPKVIDSEPATTSTSGESAFQNAPAMQEGITTDEHTVVVEEILNTDKYTYMNVSENGGKFWMAIPKSEVKVGDTYYFRGGLLKRNFQSREYNRVFETLYLVSDYRKAGGSAVDEALNKVQTGTTVSDDKPVNVSPAPGAIKISELVANAAKYEGKMVKLTGKITKVNPRIMGRNWLHIQDGSADKYDMTVTTDADIAAGTVVSLEGTIVLNKDFGAGYKYDILMEGAVLAK